MRRLHVKLFFALMAAMTVYFVCWAVIELWLEPRDPDRLWALERFERLAREIVPAAAASEAELRQELERLRDVVGADLAVYGPAGTLLASAGDPLPRPEPGTRGWFAGSETQPVVALHLDDRRTLVAAPSPPIRSERPELLALAVFVPMVLLATYVLTRWMTRRIETLTQGVDRLGQGKLETRVPVRGSDEISVLAQGFNRAAARIQQLVGAQRSMLTMVSHELRSPLARLRVAVELQAERPDPEMQRQARRDIADLDELIEQLLLASRLQARGAPERRDPVDLLALSAEEGARVGADVSGQAVQIEGDAVYLRRLLRNLFENAQRYGSDGTIEATVSALPHADGVRITVSDRGPGVPDADREKIFEPFYRAAAAAEHARGGIGLGLALVRQITEHHGGEVRCLARAGGGTTFQVDLPR